MEKKDKAFVIFMVFAGIMFIYILIAGRKMAIEERKESLFSVSEWVVEDKTIIDHGPYISSDYYLDIAEKENIGHKKRISVSAEEYEDVEECDIIKLKFFYNEEDLIDVEIIE